MRRRTIYFALLLMSAISSCGGGDKRTYAYNDLQLLTRYAAKELCSCIFVMGRDEEYCSRWTRASPNLKTFHIDRDHKRVQTEAVLFWGARAHFVSPRTGCVLE